MSRFFSYLCEKSVNMNFTAWDIPDWVKLELFYIRRQYDFEVSNAEEPIKVEAYVVNDNTIEYIVKYKNWADEVYQIKLGLKYRLYPEQILLLMRNNFNFE